MNIYCPNCENECSEAAPICPKCGHPLAEPVADREEGNAYAETGIGMLYLVGTALVAIGLIAAVLSVEFGSAALIGGLAAVVLGILIRAAGGLWASVERISRK